MVSFCLVASTSQPMASTPGHIGSTPRAPSIQRLASPVVSSSGRLFTPEVIEDDESGTFHRALFIFMYVHHTKHHVSFIIDVEIPITVKDVVRGKAKASSPIPVAGSSEEEDESESDDISIHSVPITQRAPPSRVIHVPKEPAPSPYFTRGAGRQTSAKMEVSVPRRSRTVKSSKTVSTPSKKVKTKPLSQLTRVNLQRADMEAEISDIDDEGLEELSKSFDNTLVSHPFIVFSVLQSY
jgi:hypothetical protein